MVILILIPLPLILRQKQHIHIPIRIMHTQIHTYIYLAKKTSVDMLDTNDTFQTALGYCLTRRASVQVL